MKRYLEKRICKECFKSFIFSASPSNIKLNKGSFCSFECKNKNRCKKMIGNVPWNKNKKMPDGFSEKISKIVKGRRYPIDCRKKLSLRLKGIKRSEKAKLNMSKATIGRFSKNKHWNWKGGISSENSSIRGSHEIYLWRKAVLERDNFTCQKTGQKGGKLVVHHINNFSNFPELRTSISNGVTLSLEAHRKFHRKYGIKNNTGEQLNYFLHENI